MSEDDASDGDGELTGRDLLERGATFPIAELIERWQRRQMAPQRDAPLFMRLPLPTSVDPTRWSRGVEIHERELPEALYQDLRERTPQALLRDLHRPVLEFYVELQPVEGTEVIGQLALELDKARRARRREPRPTVEPTSRVFAEEQERRRSFLAAPWQPIFQDDAPRKGVRVWQDVEEKEEFYVPDFTKYGK